MERMKLTPRFRDDQFRRSHRSMYEHGVSMSVLLGRGTIAKMVNLAHRVTIPRLTAARDPR